MIYRRNQTVGLDNQYDKYGGMVGDTAIGVVSAINPLAGLAAQGVRMIGKAMPRDEYGIHTSDFGAAVSGALDPASLLDGTIKDFKDGNTLDGIVNIINPAGAAIKDRRDSLDELEKKQRDKVDYEVGEMNPLAGKFSGNAVGTSKTITSMNVAQGTNKKINGGDVALLANTAMNFKGSDQAKGMLKSAEKIDLNSTGEVPEADADIFNEKEMDSVAENLDTESLFKTPTTVASNNTVNSFETPAGIGSVFNSQNQTEGLINKMIPEQSSLEIGKQIDMTNAIDSGGINSENIPKVSFNGLFNPSDVGINASRVKKNKELSDEELKKELIDYQKYY